LKGRDKKSSDIKKIEVGGLGLPQPMGSMGARNAAKKKEPVGEKTGSLPFAEVGKGVGKWIVFNIRRKQQLASRNRGTGSVVEE